MDKNELSNLRRKTERKQELKVRIAQLQDEYSDLAISLEQFKKKKKMEEPYEKALSEYEAVKKELKKREDEMLGLKDCDKEYEETLQKFIGVVRERGGEKAIQLEKLIKELDVSEQKKKEISLLYNEGCTAFELGRDVVRTLEEAKKWRVTDIFLGDRFITENRYDLIYEAQSYLTELKLQLSRFGEVLEKSNYTCAQKEKLDLDVNVGIAANFYTQKVILETRNKVVTVCGKLKDILAELEIVVNNEKMGYNEARNEVVDFILNMD